MGWWGVGGGVGCGVVVVVSAPGGCLLWGGSALRGVSALGGLLWGVSAPGGVSALGCLLWGGVYSGDVCSRGWGCSGLCLLGGGSAPGGNLLWGGVYSGESTRGGGGLADPPVNRMTDACKNITLPQLRCG